MSICRRLEKRLYEYAVGELEASESRMVESHIESCAKCKENVREIRLITETAQQERKTFLGESFWRRFDEQLSLRLARESVTDGGIKGLLGRIFSFPRISFVTAALSVCLLLVAISIPLQDYLSAPAEMVLNEQGMVETVLLMEQSGEFFPAEDEDSYIEEFILEMELDQA